jgi:hypothetical protein
VRIFLETQDTHKYTRCKMQNFEHTYSAIVHLVFQNANSSVGLIVLPLSPSSLQVNDSILL